MFRASCAWAGLPSRSGNILHDFRRRVAFHFRHERRELTFDVGFVAPQTSNLIGKVHDRRLMRVKGRAPHVPVNF